jgi:hypothetical protein
LQIADCRLQIADCRLQIADCRLQIADCRLQIAVILEQKKIPNGIFFCSEICLLQSAA